MSQPVYPRVAGAPHLADLIIKAGAIYSMTIDRKVYRAIALRDEWIVAVSEDRNGLDGLITSGTQVVDDLGLTLLPAFNDSHNHFILAAEAISYVDVDGARSIADLVELIRQRAANTPPGQWIRSSDAWSETNLAERRLPTAAELDRATRQHPVWVKRGGHVGSANSVALQMAGITRDTADPQHGKIKRLPDGSPAGDLEAAPALTLVEKLIPVPPFEQRIEDLRKACRLYNAYGIGTVRDPIVTRDQMLVYQALWERGDLTVRSRPMYLVQPGPVSDCIREVDGLGIRSGFGDEVLKIWGLKTLMDGGAASAALDAPYADNPHYTGNVFWKTEDLVEVANFAVRRGWRIGIHALGDKAVRTVIDAYEQVISDNPGLKPGTLAIEHAFLVDAKQRARYPAGNRDHRSTAAHLCLGCATCRKIRP